MKKQLENYFDRLWPICRSITGNGVRESLDILSEIVPLEIVEVASGTQVFDWTVPKEWNINDAYILTPDGRKIADFKVNNLHIVSYSIPFSGKVSWEELAQHLHTLPSQPDAIPYITSYYKEKWGFCITHREWEQLPRTGDYTVVIDSTLENGHLTYGHCILPGETDEEVLFSTYVCHPSMANNELSGPLTQAFLYKQLAAMPNRRYTYRFIFIPETIGAIVYLAQHGALMKEKMKAGFVLTCCGDNGIFRYKQSRRGDALPDRAVQHLLKFSGQEHSIRPFAPDGSDERQFCSPGFNLPVGSLMRTSYYLYSQYHTSFDNKSFIDFAAMEETVMMYAKTVELIEWEGYYINTSPFCEPQLGKRGLYPDTISAEFKRDYLDNMLYLLNFSDGHFSLLDIAEKRGRSLFEFIDPLKKCMEAGLIKRA
jgi:aminopeptidase-like protein